MISATRALLSTFFPSAPRTESASPLTPMMAKASVARRQFALVWHHRHARPAPSRPDHQHHRLATVLRQFHRLILPVPPLDFRNDLANAEVANLVEEGFRTLLQLVLLLVLHNLFEEGLGFVSAIAMRQV